MDINATTRGLLIFGLILLAMLVVSLYALQVTGIIGIEERFTTALGIGHDEGENGHDHESEGGFFIEGNPAAYLFVLLLLIACSLYLYRRI